MNNPSTVHFSAVLYITRILLLLFVSIQRLSNKFFDNEFPKVSARPEADPASSLYALLYS